MHRLDNQFKGHFTGHDLTEEDLDRALQEAAEEKLEEKLDPTATSVATAELRCVKITTNLDGAFGGKSYVLRFRAEDDAEAFDTAVREAHAGCLAEYRFSLAKQRIQRRLNVIYGHSAVQTTMALLILANFIASMVELQLRGTSPKLFKTLDVVFTLIFLCELLLNMACNWFWKFWGSAFNVFDFVVVVITTISLLPFVDLKVVSTLRLLRAFRIVRIFGRLASARRIITAIASSLAPVCNVIVVVTGVMCVFAMFGATAYQDSPQFATFGDAMYTMFITLCLDGWNDLVETTEEYYPGAKSLPPKLFFISYIFVIVYILLPVFVAAILDGYRTSSYHQSQQESASRGKKAIEHEDNQMPRYSFDPMLHALLTCASREQLLYKLKLIFQVFDIDEDGAVSFEEMRLGVRKMMTAFSTHGFTDFTHDEFEALCNGKMYLNQDGHLDFENFVKAMESQLQYYCKRKLCQYMLATSQEEPGSVLMMFALKLIIEHNEKASASLLTNPRTHSAENGNSAQTCQRHEPCPSCGCPAPKSMSPEPELHEKIDRILQHQDKKIDRILQHLEANGKAPVHLSDPYMRVETGGAGGHGARSQNWVTNEYSELNESGGGVNGIAQEHRDPSTAIYCQPTAGRMGGGGGFMPRGTHGNHDFRASYADLITNPVFVSRPTPPRRPAPPRVSKL